MTTWREPKNLDQCHSIADLRDLARRRIPYPIFHYLDGAAETELTAERNTTAFDELRLLPKCLVDVASVRTETRVLGQALEWPLLCSPTGASRFFHADGELAAARATAAAGAFYSLACMSTVSLEEVAEATAVPGKRERDLRTGMKMPPRLSLGVMATFARRPTWLLGQARKGALTLPNVANRTARNSFAAHSQYFGEQLDPSVTWNDVGEMVSQWGGPFAIKGIMRVEDAQRAADVGATAVIVSNHGGRQLDGAASPIEVLPAIASAVGDRVDIILDGGIRRGVHMLKALALGAKACSIGRPYLYGLSAGGEPGVAKALQILRSEFSRAMQLCGCTDVRDIDAGIVLAS